MLTKANELFGEDYRPFPDFTTFDVEGSIPTASDVVMMLDQYSEALKQFRGDHWGAYGHKWNLPKPEIDDSGEEDDDETDEDDDDFEDETDDDDEEDDAE